MGKSLRTILIILCIAGFGTFGFAAYKVYDTGFSRSDKPTSSMSETSVSEQSGTIAVEPVTTIPVQQAGNSGFTGTYSSGDISWEVGPLYTRCVLDDFTGYYYGVLSFPVTNTGTAEIDLPYAKADLVDASGQIIQTEEYILAAPEIIRPGETAWYYRSIITNQGSFSSAIIHDIQPNRNPYPSYLGTQLSVHDITFDSNENSVYGIVENITDEYLPSTIYAMILFFDDQGNNYERTEAVTAGLHAGESKKVYLGQESLFTRLQSVPESQYKIIAFPAAGPNYQTLKNFKEMGLAD